MTNHIASTSRWRLRAGMLADLTGRALDHLRQAFSGFIAPELAAEAVRRSAQRTVALLPAPAPTVDPTIVGLVEGLAQSGLRAAEPVAATPSWIAVGDTIETPLPVQLVRDDQPAPIPPQGATKRARLPAKTAKEPAIVLAAAEPATAFSPDAPKRGQARDQAAVPFAVGQPQADPLSRPRTVSRQPRKDEGGHFAPKVGVPPAEMLVAKPFAALPTSVEGATAGRIEKPTPVGVLAPEVHPPTPQSRRDLAARALPQAGSEPAAAQSRGEPKPAGRARNKTPALIAATVALRRTGRKPRRAGETVTADRASDSEGSSDNSSVVAG